MEATNLKIQTAHNKKIKDMSYNALLNEQFDYLENKNKEIQEELEIKINELNETKQVKILLEEILKITEDNAKVFLKTRQKLESNF